jgi:nicotinamide phosphoribosyltransferase
MKKIKEKRIKKIKKTVTNELNGIRYLLSKYPSGILSMVSDTFDLWRMCTEYLPILKEEILARDGKLVIRPDSGDPVDILCGLNTDKDLIHTFEIAEEPEYKGVIELLWDVFGGTINEQGYKVLDSHIGAIYGDSITIDRANEICERLEAKGFASTNVVLGVGSFTYQYNTRDTFGFAMKATYVEVKEHFRTVKDENGNYTHSEEIVRGREIFKDPITDDGTKKSATGLLCVTLNEEKQIYLVDKVDWETESEGLLETIYQDGEFFNPITLSEIREKLVKELESVTEKV